MMEIEKALTKNTWYSDYNKLEKFGEGPWLDEPDYVTWVDEDTGYPCIVRRNKSLGFLCGYVSVPGKHPLHGKEYECPEVECHGGLTYAGRCSGSGDEEHPICHKTDSNDDVWWFGFDCGHGGDFSPFYAGNSVKNLNLNMTRDYFDGKEIYRDIEYVKDQCKTLAKQLKEYQETPNN